MQTLRRSRTPSAAHDEPSAPGAPDWFVTYADLMSLLLTFFIMLAALSDVRS